MLSSLGVTLSSGPIIILFSAEVKGGSMCIRPRRIIITSNYSLEQCFGDPAVLEPLRRRFKVKHFSAVAADACVLPPQ